MSWLKTGVQHVNPTFPLTGTAVLRTSGSLIWALRHVFALKHTRDCVWKVFGRTTGTFRNYLGLCLVLFITSDGVFHRIRSKPGLIHWTGKQTHDWDHGDNSTRSHWQWMDDLNLHPSTWNTSSAAHLGPDPTMFLKTRFLTLKM